MSSPPSIQPDPSAIGGVPKAPFVRLPDPAALFARRAARFQTLATGDLAPYLRFLGAIATCQASILADLPEPQRPEAAAYERARQFAMPLFDRTAVAADPVLHTTFAALFAALVAVDQPTAAATALTKVRALAAADRDQMIANVLGYTAAPEQAAEQALIAAGLQVHFARLASGLAESAANPLDIGVCPACGGPPAVSVIAGWHGAEGARYAVCAFCATWWNEVRVKCLACGSTKGIGYQEVAGGTGLAKAETCDACECYVKVLYQQKDMALDPVADDVASLDLDLLMRQGGKYRRAGVNPFLAGY